MTRPSKRPVLLAIVVSIMLASGLIGLVLRADETPAATSPRISLTATAADSLTLALAPPDAKAGVAEVEVWELSGKKAIARSSHAHDGKPFSLKIAAKIKPDDLAGYYLRFRFDEKAEFERQSLFFLGEILETTVLGHRDLLAGTTPSLRILVRNRADGTPIAGAKVAVQLLEKDKAIARLDLVTNAQGEATPKIALPDREIAGAQLAIDVTGRTARDSIRETINIKPATRTLLTTDKAMYQPGQIIHMRSLSLSRPSMKPLAGADVVFEVADAKGNKVFKQAVKADAYGIAFADFVLADELNKGAYRIRAIVAGAPEEKTVTVDRYVLPKFKVEFATDRKFYQPGETVKVDLQSDYFFGKPVSGGKVEVKCAKFDVAYEEFQTVSGELDDKGHYSFEVKLPTSFVGQPFEAGKASVRFDIAITDTADHKETVTRNVTVTGAPIIIAAVPEGGDLVPGLENRVYVVTTYADGTPAACEVEWTNTVNRKPVIVRTDEGGFGQVTLPKATEAIAMELSARDAKGAKATAKVNLSARGADDAQVLLRTGKSLHRVGDKLDCTVLSTRKTGTIYLDIIKDNQTQLTRTLELADGKAADSLALDAALAGTLQVNAWTIGESGIIVRDRRVVVVDPANDLKIAIKADQDTYLPAAEAKLNIAVSDSSGSGVPSALGVMVVDEAVFALQEMQPGLEKVYFYLEKEIATPRYEIHGYSIDTIVPDQHWAMDVRRDTAARVLLAAAKAPADYPLHVNTYQRDNKAADFQQRMAQSLMPQYQKVQEAFARHGQKLQKQLKGAALPPEKRPTIEMLIKEGDLKAEDLLDPWGVKMQVKLDGWCDGCKTYHALAMASAGLDGKWNTADDISMPNSLRGELADGGVWFGGAGAGGMMRNAAPMRAAAAEPMLERNADLSRQKEQGEGAGGESPSAAPRIRQFFPETLYFNPAVITDGRGQATLSIPLADSITTWRMTAMASSAYGALGSTTAPLRVFQDFFVDIDFPVALTQGDEVSVPVAVYNYLKTDQEVKLVAEAADWYELKTERQQVVKLAPSEVRAVYFPIVARKVGFQKFTVMAYGSKKSDAVARSVEIVPNGKEMLVTFSGRLTGPVEHEIVIPDDAIADASKVFVKVYPGILSQVVEGLDSMLRMPGGCFEQTSSIAYPNILVMDYLKTTRKITPEIQMKAEGFINAGYQRLVSFEVPGGGFEWFGKAPAHRILTAYGLMEFHDMSKVHPVDPAIISRTQQWLARGQEADGSYKPTQGGIAEGAINKFRDDVLRNTAYVTWALASTGYKGPEVDKAVKFINEKLDEIKDPYTLALVANALATVEPEGKATLAVLRTLHNQRTEEGELVYYKAQSETPTFGTGSAADIEVTALAAQAFIRCGQELTTVSKMVSYLAKNKDAYGNWQSTQATIQALRAMLMAERGATAKADATIALNFNGNAPRTLKVDDNNADVLQLVDLKEQTRSGKNTISLNMQGKGALMYQVVGRYYMPHELQTVEAHPPMLITVDYDKRKLATDDIITVKATVANNRQGTRAQMVLVDLGLPPGFTLINDRLNKAVEAGMIEKYQTTGRQIIVYLREVPFGRPVTIEYQLLAK